jgi:hypothetical protein
VTQELYQNLPATIQPQHTTTQHESIREIEGHEQQHPSLDTLETLNAQAPAPLGTSTVKGEGFQQGDRSASRKRRENQQENQAAEELQHQPGGKNRIAEEGAHDGRTLANWAKDRRKMGLRG